MRAPGEDTWPTVKGQEKLPRINNIKARSAGCTKPEISRWGGERMLQKRKHPHVESPRDQRLRGNLGKWAHFRF